MEEILKRLEYLANQIGNLNLEKNVVEMKPLESSRAKTSLQDEPELYGCFPSTLQELRLLSCGSSFGSLNVDLFPNLKTLEIAFSHHIEVVSMSDGKSLEELTSFTIRSCNNFVSFLDGGLIAPKLSEFIIRDCSKLKWLPKKMTSLLSLESLAIVDCPLMETFPKGEGVLPVSLSTLEISCDNSDFKRVSSFFLSFSMNSMHFHSKSMEVNGNDDQTAEAIADLFFLQRLLGVILQKIEWDYRSKIAYASFSHRGSGDGVDEHCESEDVGRSNSDKLIGYEITISIDATTWLYGTVEWTRKYGGWIKIRKSMHCMGFQYPNGHGRFSKNSLALLASRRNLSLTPTARHTVFMLTLTKHGGLITICESTRLICYEITLSIEATTWNGHGSMEDCSEYAKVCTVGAFNVRMDIYEIAMTIDATT
ncbi:hypothetical protein F8388_025678 [Cannabis sativa]|uniref:Uncharacterized protein n=1 Tax=Cannabis sativa TaxID=3483 RepID=A0A7J6G1S9_CANSA|nr:hypothetical protein F8388_025678 [Cannabis sativa]